MWPTTQPSNSWRNKMDSPFKKNGYERHSKHKKKIDNKVNFFVLPSPANIPQFPIPRDLTTVVMKNLKSYEGMTEKSRQFLMLLEKIKSAEGLDIKETNHLQILKLMLYLEEIANNLDMRRFDQFDKTIFRISKTKQIFKVFVDGLSEDRPSVRPNDIVEVRDSQSKVLFILKITNVMNDHIIVAAGKRFCEQYQEEKYYNIRFRYPNYTIRCSHYALTLISLYQLTPHFFPVKMPTYNKPSSNQHWFNKTVEENPQQKQAVLNITCKSSYPAPYILYGPPGTGKTATLVEAICQAWESNPSDHILVCTPSNSAADVITKRLLEQKIPEHNLYRMYSPSKEGSQIDDEIIGCSNYVDGQIMMLPRELVVLKKIVITTLCACTRLIFLDLREKHFSFIFIDEAGQAIEPDSMIPFTLLSSIKEGRIGRLHGQVIIAGDPQQLGPGIRSKIAETILGKSLLERLMECEPYRKNEHGQYNPSYITKLLRNYRSHPEIISVSNALFYEDELIACGDENNIRKAENWRNLEKPKFPIIFHGVDGTETKDIRSPSAYNVEEVKIVLHYVKLLMGQKFKGTIVSEKDIGIITPFVAQRQKLHRALKEEKYCNIDVGTVELFQGQEKDIIILSTVRSRTFLHEKRFHIGFLSNPKRFNVALTRAKALLIVTGNPTVLQTDKYWNYFLNFCKRNNACRGISFETESDINTQIRLMRALNKPKNVTQINCSALDIVELDDGVITSSDSSMIDENEYPKSPPQVNSGYTSNYTIPLKGRNARVETTLGDIEIKRLSDLKLEKAAAKKDKKKKKNKADS